MKNKKIAFGVVIGLAVLSCFVKYLIPSSNKKSNNIFNEKVFIKKSMKYFRGDNKVYNFIKFINREYQINIKKLHYENV